MKITKEINKVIIRDEHFDPCQTLECGQVFRFRKNSENDYFIHSLNHRCRIYKECDCVVLETDVPDYFIDYFDLGTDYKAIINELKIYPELGIPISYGLGIRILKQDLLETIISFIISANNNIPRIKGIIERLCAKCGDNMGDYYAFPTLTQLFPLTIEDFRLIGCGFRADYLYNTVRMLISGVLEVLPSQDTPQALKTLLKLKGVGPKVADCILLFGLGKTDSYPVDTWIFQANKSDELNSPQKVHEYYTQRYGSLAGYAQQYIFYHKRELA